MADMMHLIFLFVFSGICGYWYGRGRGFKRGREDWNTKYEKERLRAMKNVMKQVEREMVIGRKP